MDSISANDKQLQNKLKFRYVAIVIRVLTFKEVNPLKRSFI